MVGVDLFKADKAYRDKYGEGRPGDHLNNILLGSAFVRYFTILPKSKYCLGEQNEKIMQSILFTDEWRMRALANRRGWVSGFRPLPSSHPIRPVNKFNYLTITGNNRMVKSLQIWALKYFLTCLGSGV